MSSDLAIQVSELSKCYHIYNSPRDRLLQMLMRKHKTFYREFWALKDVSFGLSRGETVGIIGNNGAGKSTLLQIIAGTVAPTSGTVKVNGRVAALLELGSGFNTEFSGRENVYLNAKLLGLTDDEIWRRFDEILAFADIGDFIDQPVKTYSSGMFARLAFSVAIHVEPSILIVDEVLSVGDMAFQEKSITRMKRIREAGTTILFVSHSLSAVRNFCDRAIWIDHGQIRAVGERLQICDEYQREVEQRTHEGAVDTRREIRSGAIRSEESTQNQTVAIHSVVLDKNEYRMGDDIHITIELAFTVDTLPYGVGVIIYDRKGQIVTILNTLRDELFVSTPKTSWTLVIRDNHFGPGEYSITISIPDDNAMFSYDKWDYCARFSIQMERTIRGLARVDGIVRCDHDWL